MNQESVQEPATAAKPTFAELLKDMPTTEVVRGLQELCNTHRLAVAVQEIPQDANPLEFLQSFLQKMESATGKEARIGTAIPADSQSTLERMLRQKAEMERANIQHCEHNSRASVSLQLLSMVVAHDATVDGMPESFRTLFDSACNALRDFLTGVPATE